MDAEQDVEETPDDNETKFTGKKKAYTTTPPPPKKGKLFWPQTKSFQASDGYKNPFLTFFHADFGKEVPSRNLLRDPSLHCPSPSSALWPLLYRTEQFSRGRKGRKCAEKRGGRGVASKGGKKEKRTRENRSVLTPPKPYLPPKSFLCGSQFCGKDKFLTGAGWCMASFSQVQENSLKTFRRSYRPLSGGPTSPDPTPPNRSWRGGIRVK